MYDLNYYLEYYDLHRKEIETRQIRRLGLLTGSALISLIIIQNLFVPLLALTGLYQKYINDPLFQTGVDIIISLLSILVPFAVFGKYMKTATGIKNRSFLNAPKDKTLCILAVPAGLGICMAANIITSYIVIFMQALGFELSSPSLANPQGIFGFLVSAVRVAVVAAFAEETALRGYTMQPLRKYGDTFAIVMSACVFGLMHGNLVQAPFAVIAGIGLGYICIKTDSLWIPIIIHGLNNLISTTVSYLLNSGLLSDGTINLVYGIILYGLIIAGIPCLFVFVNRANRIMPSYKSDSPLNGAQKAWAYISNPTMIIAIVFMLYCTAKFIARR